MTAGGDSTIHRIGLISDTHGRLDNRVERAFTGVERIIHAGDVGRPDVLWELQLIAPIAAVAGNVDRWEMPEEELPLVARLTLYGVRVVVTHIRADLSPEVARDADVVVFGHSHMPLIERTDSVLWVNPGSASQSRRSEIGRSVAVLELREGHPPFAAIVALNDFGEQQ